jgi:hypothetical protein
MAIENLSTSRVLVVDDKPAEAIPILTALGEAGVGCVYVKGDKAEELPTKLAGIRLVFLDMRLGEGGDQKSVLSKTLSVLKKCISENTMPLVVVCWTRHPDDVAAFKAMVTQDFPGLMGDYIVAMPKPTSGSPDKWRNTLRRIEKILRPYDALGLLWQWENVLHEAATETSQTLADTSARMGANSNSVAAWQEGMFSVCRELIRAYAGKISDGKAVSNALFHMINELAMDRIHHAVLKGSLPCADKLIPHSDSDLGLDDTSRLNQMILVEPVTRDDTSMGPGFVYVQSRGTANCLFKKLGIGIKLIRKYIKGQLAKPIIPILIEMSPACDFAQGQRDVCTFIAGLLVPVDPSRKSDGHREVIGPVMMPGYTGAKQIVVTKRLVYACALSPSDISNRPICRLRSNVLIDLQVKTAMFKARPGTVCLEVGKKAVRQPTTAVEGNSRNGYCS